MKRFLIALTMLAGLVTPLAATTTVSAVDVFKACPDSAETGVCSGTDDKVLGPNGILTKVINLLLTIIGIIAVIMIIVGGIRYVTSGGDSGQINSAKDTIIYAVVGVVIAIMSFAIVNFVLVKI